MTYTSALIVGAGAGLSASLARAFAKEGMKVALAARSPGKLEALAKETGARSFECDASQRYDVAAVFTALDEAAATPDVVVYNASYRTRGPLVELDPAEVEKLVLDDPEIARRLEGLTIRKVIVVKDRIVNIVAA